MVEKKSELNLKKLSMLLFQIIKMGFKFETSFYVWFNIVSLFNIFEKKWDACGAGR